MIGIALQLIISWLLLKYLQHQNLNSLGLNPTRRRMGELAAGLLLPVIYVCLFEFSVAAIVHNPFRVNPAYSSAKFGAACYYLFKAVWFEDLLFRGALLYILMQRIGAQRAILLSAAAFGIYHWFSWNAFGNPASMLIIFLMTGSAGYVFALAFQRTGSMYLAAALHFGIDLANGVIFSHDKGLGQQLLIKTFAHDPVSPAAWIGLPIVVIHFIGFQVLAFIGLVWYGGRKKKAC